MDSRLELASDDTPTTTSSSSEDTIFLGGGDLCVCKDERCCLCRLFDIGSDGDGDGDGEGDLANVCVSDFEAESAMANRELLCIRCGTLPVSRIIQCQNGHLICEGCYQVLVLDKMLRESLGTCPKCSVRMYRHLPNRNIAVEGILAKLQVRCEQCRTKMLRSALRSHFRGECPERLVYCKYRRIGCPWYGSADLASDHDATCEWPSKTGAELMEFLLPIQAKREAKKRLLQQIQEMMKLPHLTVRILQVLPQISNQKFKLNEFIEVHKFRAFCHCWSLLLMWQTPAASVDNLQPMASVHMCLQLIPPEDWSSKLKVSYTLVHGTHSEVLFLPNFCDRFEFSSEKLCGPPAVIYRHTMYGCQKLLLQRGIYVRLLIAQIK